ncbi:SDR family NAD(P)-dependent oxidoreductase [Burkholderia multivorans]|uniref:SDR family NAD(P)-dependent oxidoreductase n=1 Tax=Burkholderia multivorans TaxID=87883 RepID=UPI00158DE7F7|nr:SDR family NAD(P)-dependent oxidoreductase [Burkholderia multivorans]
MLLENKVCVIVGAASLRGIGYATAELFAQHGAKIVAVDVVMDDKISGAIKASIGDKTGRDADVIGIRCDISDSEDCKRLFRDVVDRFGTVDCLVNSAAIVKAQPMLTIEDGDLDRMLDVNLKGAFNLCKSALEIFSEQKRGTIVNVASVAAQRGGGLVGGAHYAASKGGVLSLTRTIAREFGHVGIRANAVCPSMIETSMIDGMSPERYKEIVAPIPLQRAGRPAEIAGACLFLASDLSSYVTGATIDVNGGSHIH